MNKKTKITLVTLGILVVVSAVIIGVLIYWDNSQKVTFVDEEMGNVITYAAYKNGDIDSLRDFRQNNLENIKKLNIGFTGYYSTLADLEKCTQLEELYIGFSSLIAEYYKVFYVVPEAESEEKIAQIERELTSILENCSEMRILWIINTEGTCELTNLEFLKGASNLEVLTLNKLGELEYTPIFYCSSLVALDLYGCEISNIDGISKLESLTYLYLDNTNINKAGEIVELSNLEVLDIGGTPLAENEEELALIYEALPNIDLRK